MLRSTHPSFLYLTVEGLVRQTAYELSTFNLQFANSFVSDGVSFNPAREQQREGRLRRIGLPQATYRHWIVLPDAPVVMRQLSALSRKRADGSSSSAPTDRRST